VGCARRTFRDDFRKATRSQEVAETRFGGFAELGPVNTTGVGGVVDENRPRLGGGRGLRLFPGEDDNEVWAYFPDFCAAPR